MGLQARTEQSRPGLPSRHLFAGTSSSFPVAAVSLRASVIIPTYRRPASLARCLAALARQTLGAGEFEVIVCVDGDAESLAPVLEQAGGVVPLRTVAQPHAGPAAARNRAAAAARGRLLAFIDDDCAPAADWLARLLEWHEREPGALLGGTISNALTNSVYAAATQIVTNYAYDYAASDPESALPRFSTSNLAVPADRFHALGGFSLAFPRAAGEDYDLCARWQDAGWPVAPVREALVWHAHDHDLRSFCRQHLEYGRALLRVHRRVARRRARTLRLERPRFYMGLLAAPLRTDTGARRWTIAVLVLVSQIATIVGAVCEIPYAGSEGNGREPQPLALDAGSL